ncbi:S28 family serine protease [uncultured Rikenella sp.]|uniref:S28 family serine protease n=1 Tax=uncultured Rikenella sp. TaxID=368003 RepID=UPI002606C82E|nr:S28 family serine protease [uncultured Rikenella sp.]
MRYLKFTFAFFALLLAGLTFAGATELYDRLIALKGVVSVEELEKGLFEERYAVMFEQPLDHRRPGKGHFEQRFVVAHTGFDRPTVLVTEGYGGARAVGTRYREELSEHLNANQVFVEHRYFGESTPEPRNWHYLNAEQAAADLHAVREALREIYPEKWVATGVSKGGENSLIYRMYYPEDVDVTVAYVGPVCFGVEDGRHEPFLDRVGTDEERATIREFQTEVLKRRKELVPLFDEYCKSKSYTFRTNIDEVFDLCVLEYPFSIWQWGTATSLIPAPDSPHQELLDHLIAIVSPDYFAVNDEPSFFVQAQRELGYYGYDTAPFEGLLSIRDARGYLPRIMLPDDARNIRFSDGLSRRIVSFYKANDPKVICIYGENDPWSAAMPDSTLFEGKTNMKLFVEPGGSHRARIKTQSEEVQAEIWEVIEGWLFGI